MSTESPSSLLYLILGASGSGRRAVLTDLIAAGLDGDDVPVVLLSEGETAAAEDATLPRVARWRLAGGALEVAPEAWAGATHVFLVLDGGLDPADQIEAVKPWWQATGLELARVITIVDCTLASAHPQLAPWFDACIHFSDAVLLTRREGVANKWMSDFQARYRDLFYPCLFELVREGRVRNPPLLLEPEARRMSHYFDETDWVVDGEDDDFEAGAEDEDGREVNEEVEMKEEVDPWLERRNGGRRVRELPDIRRYLGKS
ncbi:hypothetical protein [Nibricoccus sp. IMCC34717]|uniref:hypothetical protein n=1 Tax=Nibricoccus sp. IMCC34717 TaxID=3034021 RepID=UPI00384BE052